MIYSYKFRLYPNKKQEDLIIRTMGCCRYVYNHYLVFRKTEYEQNGKNTSYVDCSKKLTDLKKQPETKWLQEVDSTALQSSLKDLDTAYKNFFAGLKNGKKVGYPKLKSKRCGHQSYKSTRAKVFDSAVQLPKLGLIKCRVSKKVCGRVLSATVSKNPSGKYFVSLCCTDVAATPLQSTGKSVGVDVGIKFFAVTSDGEKYENHKYLSKNIKKLAKKQRQLSRKQTGSKNQEKARIRVARLYEQVSNQRNDMLHKLSTDLVRKNDIICVENLAIQNLIKNHKLSRSIFDAAWGEFKRQLVYKAEWYSKRVIVVDRFFPSSQLCCNCGFQFLKLKDLHLRNWDCPQCGAIHDRDVNAAKNILNAGLKMLM